MNHQVNDNMDDRTAQIAAVREHWVEAINAGSAGAFVRRITEDAVWVPPRGEALHGRKAIAAWLEPLFDAYEYAYMTADERVRLAGGWAVEEARFRTVVRPRAEPGDALVHDGRYLLIWRRLPTGQWLIERYVDRTPAAGSAAD